jgi:hypothetical protein
MAALRWEMAMVTLKPGQEMARVLITVKTYPAPSQKYGETVCIAGVRLDGPRPTFIRLYPVPFRMLDGESQFKKYQIVDVPVRARGTHDPRPESYEPVGEGFELGEVIDPKKGWSKRADLIAPLIGATSVCELIAKNRAGTMADSIESFGLIKPEVRRIEVLTGQPWTARQLEKVHAATEPTLFNENGLVELQPIPYRIKFKYRCAEPGCRGHDQELIDWELGVAGLMWPRRYGADTAAKIEEKWSENVDSTRKDVHFYVGNQHQRRQSFSVCGIWHPPL